MKQYRIVYQSRIGRLEEEVNECLGQRWDIVGHPFEYNGNICQAMVRWDQPTAVPVEERALFSEPVTFTGISGGSS